MKNKKIISVLLSACMLLTAIAGISFSATAGGNSGSCGDGVVWSVDDSGTLTISGDGQMNDYSLASGAPWRNSIPNIKSIIVKNDVNYIGDYAFSGCVNATSATIEGSVQIIGIQAFSGCVNLKNVDVAEGVYVINEEAFTGCISLTDITLPSTTSAICEKAFNGCVKLTDVTYNGTMEEWAEVPIDEGNDALANAQIRCADGIINEKKEEPPTETPSENQETTQKHSESTSAMSPADLEQMLISMYNNYVTRPTTTTTTTKRTLPNIPMPSTTAGKPVVVEKPSKTPISKLTSGKKQFGVSWKRVYGVNGYQIQYSTDKKLKKDKKSININGSKKVSTTIKGLKSKKTYYVRVRTYVTVNGQKVYSSWSKIKSVKTK